MLARGYEQLARRVAYVGAAYEHGRAGRVDVERVGGSRTPEARVEQEQEGYGTIVVGKRGIPKAEEFLFGSISSALIHTGKDIAVWVIG